MKIVTELSKRMGLDGFALCAAQEDFSLVDELNIDMSEYRVPWFDQIRGREIKQLFGEQHELEFKQRRRPHRYSDILSDKGSSSSREKATKIPSGIPCEAKASQK